jgi:signal transduction histidine kinase
MWFGAIIAVRTENAPMLTKPGLDLNLMQVVKTQSELINVLRELSAEMDLNVLMQRVVDEATRFTEASFGAFFHRGDDSDASVNDYHLSGGVTASFDDIAFIRRTKLFDATLISAEIIRLRNVADDPRFIESNYHQASATLHHEQVVSYLAVPVNARSGGVFGVLVFCSPVEGHFTVVHESIVRSIAAQAAVAMDNAFLLKRAQAAIKVRDDFLSVAAHEIRTPLTPLALQLQFLQSKIHLVPLKEHPKSVALKSLEIAARQVSRLTLLVEELLDVSRVRVGRLKLDLEDMDIVEMVNDLVERYLVHAEQHGNRILLDLPDEPIVGKFDIFRLQQVIINLLTNAIKYAPGVPIEVSVQTVDDKVNIRFCDYGPGIAPEDQERIFNRFERANSDFKRGGLGLGLYIGREIVEAHGGSISIKSAVNKGCAFTVTLPLPKGHAL